MSARTGAQNCGGLVGHSEVGVWAFVLSSLPNCERFPNPSASPVISMSEQPLLIDHSLNLLKEKKALGLVAVEIREKVQKVKE